MSHPATVRVIVTLDESHASVQSLGDMRSMYAISQTILANSKGAALIRCGYTGTDNEYLVDLLHEGHDYSSVDELLPADDRASYGVNNASLSALNS